MILGMRTLTSTFIFPYDFLKFSGSYNFILFKNLLLYISPVIYWFALGRDRFFTVYRFLKTPYFSCKLFNKYFSLAQSTCRQFRVSLDVKSDSKTKLPTLLQLYFLKYILAIRRGVFFHKKFNISFCQIRNLLFYASKNELSENFQENHNVKSMALDICFLVFAYVLDVR